LPNPSTRNQLSEAYPLYFHEVLATKKREDKSTLLKEKSSMQIKIRHLPACLLPNRGGA
jgi:hypothetical protein